MATPIDPWQDVKDKQDLLEVLEKEKDPKLRREDDIARLRHEIRQMSGIFS